MLDVTLGTFLETSPRYGECWVLGAPAGSLLASLGTAQFSGGLMAGAALFPGSLTPAFFVFTHFPGSHLVSLLTFGRGPA